VYWLSGAKAIMSEAWPKPWTPRSAAICSGAGLSVCWEMMSAPWSIIALAASASLPGSNQELTQTTFSLKSGSTDWAPSMKELMPRTTSGIGNDAT